MSILTIWFLLSKPVQKTKPAPQPTCDKINCGHLKPNHHGGGKR